MLPKAAAASPTDSEPTLAQTINSVLDAVDWNQSDSWTALFGNIFCRQNMTAFDDAISRDVAAGDLLDALYVARLAELNNYSSPVLEAKTQQAMELMSMAGSLPATTNAKGYGDPGNGSFLVYYRYLMYCYPYADTDALAQKWNVTQAYLDFKKAYLARGEMLWIDPAANWSKSFSSRYYDEHAETLAMFLAFSDLGIPEALTYAADAWEKVQAHWNGQYYGYTNNVTVECEMANFAELAAAYRMRNNGSIPYWDRVLADLNYTLLAKGWKSPGWAQPGVIVHATSNSQLRLWETTSVIVALQQFYPYLSEDMKIKLSQLLIGDKPAWEGLTNSTLRVNNTFTFIGMGGMGPSNGATIDAAATLFLEGIVPQNGSLVIPIRNEQYQDCRTPFSVNDLMFDYTNHSIRIPVNAGAFTFIYGSDPVNCSFTRNGIYTVQFSDDWNQIMEAEYVGPINLTVTANGAPVLSWNYTGATASTQYQILRGLSVDSEAPIAITNSTIYVDDSAVNGNTYYYRVEADNKTSADFSVLYDYAPSVFSSYSNNWHMGDFTVPLSVPEGSNATICYRINGGEARTIQADGQPVISTEGAVNTIEYWSVSPLGTSQSEHLFAGDLKLDKTAPIVSLIIDGGAESTTDPAVTLAISASDISGITQMRFSLDNAQWSNWEPFAQSKYLNLSSDMGVKQVFVEVQNGAGLTAASNGSILLGSKPVPTATPTMQPTPTEVTVTPQAPEFSVFILFGIMGAVSAAALLLRQKAVTNPKKHSAHIAP
jgi:hypothetical protein